MRRPFFRSGIRQLSVHCAGPCPVPCAAQTFRPGHLPIYRVHRQRRPPGAVIARLVRLPRFWYAERPATRGVNASGHARMVEQADTRDLKSLGHRPCGFDPRSGHQETARAAKMQPFFVPDCCITFASLFGAAAPRRLSPNRRHKSPGACLAALDAMGIHGPGGRHIAVAAGWRAPSPVSKSRCRTSCARAS